MISYYGDFAEDDTVLIPFNTFDSNDPSASVTVTTLIASDIYVHKDGSITDIVTDGATIAIDFDGITGNHLITIDTSAHADYSTGSEYAVRIEGATVDGGNINAWVGAFSIERAGGVLALLKGAGGLTDINTDVEAILVDTGTTLDTKLNDIQGGTFSSATDSLEALRDRGDAAWTGSTVTSDSGTAQAGAAGTITLQAGASAIDDTYNGHLVYISSGTGAGQSRAISDYTGSSKVANVITNWGTTPDGTSVYAIYPDEITEITAAPTAASVADAVWDENTAGHTTAGTFGEQLKNDVDAILVDTATTLNDKIDVIDGIVDAIVIDTAEIGTAGAGLTNINLPNQTMDITGNLSGSVGSVTGAVGSVTGNVGGNVVGSVASVTGAVGSVTGAVGSVTGHTAQTGDTYALANGATGFAAIDTVVDAVKVQTDKLTFTVANEVDCNVESINATTVIGVGSSANKWRA